MIFCTTKSFSDPSSLKQVVMNTCEDSKCERLLTQTLTFLCARTVLDLLPVVVKENCYGCEVDHPSQTHHTCIMWTEHEHLDAYFETTFEKMNYFDVVINFQKHVLLMDILTDLKTNSDQMEEWCRIHKPSAKKVQFIAEELLSLKNKFE